MSNVNKISIGSIISDIEDSVARQEINILADKKVDKIDGKGLSSNDYTTEEKNKLAGIAADADKTIIIDNLTSETAESALSAAQGKILQDNKADKTSIPAVNDSKITIKQNGKQIGSFTLNQPGDFEINLESDGLENDVNHLLYGAGNVFFSGAVLLNKSENGMFKVADDEDGEYILSYNPFTGKAYPRKLAVAG
jgi:predicted  nucleic acid-binding Zn-ribbon protein